MIMGGMTVELYVLVFKAGNEYRRKMIRKILCDYGFRELAANVFIWDKLNLEKQLIENIRKTLNYYDSKYLFLRKGSQLILIKYAFSKRNSKNYMNVKRLLERIVALQISKGTYILLAKNSYIISELYKNVGYLEYFYLDPISKIDEKQLSEMYVEYVSNILDRLMAKKMAIRNRREALELLRNIRLLQEGVMELSHANIIDQISVISILKKLGSFKLEILKKLQNL